MTQTTAATAWRPPRYAALIVVADQAPLVLDVADAMGHAQLKTLELRSPIGEQRARLRTPYQALMAPLNIN